jgi:hypothetical protein
MAYKMLRASNDSLRTEAKPRRLRQAIYPIFPKKAPARVLFLLLDKLSLDWILCQPWIAVHAHQLRCIQLLDLHRLLIPQVGRHRIPDRFARRL